MCVCVSCWRLDSETGFLCLMLKSYESVPLDSSWKVSSGCVDTMFILLSKKKKNHKAISFTEKMDYFDP